MIQLIKSKYKVILLVIIAILSLCCGIPLEDVIDFLRESDVM